MRTVRTLSHTEAMDMIRAVQKALDDKRQGAAVAVVDAHGELLAMMRTDGCRFSCIDVAINKAYTDEQKNAMKRLFEAHGMVLTGPPLTLA